MKQSVADKYSIAWFKLAEFVSRGEKERALGVYRLLSHSIQDTAFVAQLEGDLLMAFNDDVAIDKYSQAAQLYRQYGRNLQAAAVYEHLTLIRPTILEYKQALVELYISLQLPIKLHGHIEAVIQYYIEKKWWQEITALFSPTIELYVMHDKRVLLEQLVLIMHENIVPEYVAKSFFDIFVQQIIMQQKENNIDRFVQTVRSLNQAWYEYIKEKLSYDL